MIGKLLFSSPDCFEYTTASNSCECIFNIKVIPKNVEIGSDLFNDLEVFYPYDNESHFSTLANIFHKKTATLGGKKLLDKILANPQYDMEILNQRKLCISNLCQPSTHGDISQLEQDLLWIFSEKEDTINELLNSIYFSNFILKKLNHSDTFLTSYNFYKICISPSLGLLSPLLYVILPFIVFKYKFGNELDISFNTYIRLLWQSVVASQNIFSSGGNMLNRMKIITYILTLGFYFQGIFNSIHLAYTTNKVINYISDKINNSFKFLKYALESINDNKDILDECKKSFLIDPNELMIDQYITDTLNKYKPYSSFTIFSHFGKQLRLFKEMNHALVSPIVNTFYLLDSLFAIQHVKKDLNLCSPEFLQYNETPVYQFENSWNIHLNPFRTVKNNSTIKNTIITGPNAGGKSTFIKMICTNILLAQTYCVCAADFVKLTPFYMLNSQINIPDCKGHESLFEAEMNRCLYNLNNITKFSKYPCFLVMDEIFNSTNVIEAISGAYAILENISKHQNAICVITTHLSYLTNLRKTTSFECYCMSVNIHENGIDYPYKLQKGISKQYIALELLKDRGFDPSIINKALEIKSKFTKTSLK